MLCIQTPATIGIDLSIRPYRMPGGGGPPVWSWRILFIIDMPPYQSELCTLWYSSRVCLWMYASMYVCMRWWPWCVYEHKSGYCITGYMCIYVYCLIHCICIFRLCACMSLCVYIYSDNVSTHISPCMHMYICIVVCIHTHLPNTCIYTYIE